MRARQSRQGWHRESTAGFKVAPFESRSVASDRIQVCTMGQNTGSHQSGGPPSEQSGDCKDAGAGMLIPGGGDCWPAGRRREPRQGTSSRGGKPLCKNWVAPLCLGGQMTRARSRPLGCVGDCCFFKWPEDAHVEHGFFLHERVSCFTMAGRSPPQDGSGSRVPSLACAQRGMDSQFEQLPIAAKKIFFWPAPGGQLLPKRYMRF